MSADRPAHHDPRGGFRNPWPSDTRAQRGRGGVLRWQWERWRATLPPDPLPDQLPLAAPDVAYPRAPRQEIRLTWVGHASFLVQAGGANLLTDPHWSQRASPLQWLGPKRLVPPGLPWERLPPIDAVLLSHDHYDHLDAPTVRRLRGTSGCNLRWFTPLGYGGWLAARKVAATTELDWWDEAPLDGPGGRLTITALPAQHWSSRSPLRQARRLWASWAVTTAAGERLYFGGDSGYFPEFPHIGARMGPFSAVLLPIGAYEPRWFMRPVHMDPEEAVQAYRDLGASGEFLPLHWGTFRLTDEDPLEPPRRLRAAWHGAGLDPERLRILRHGETRIVAAGIGMPTG